MPKRPLLAVLLGGTALVLVLNFKTPEPRPAAATENLPIVGSAGCCEPMASAMASTMHAASGTFTGSPFETRYGAVQVRVTLDNGRITAVEAIQAPSGDPRSSQISDFAIPMLVEATLQVQSGQVDSISGATYTCQAFAQSVQSALDQAGM